MATVQSIAEEFSGWFGGATRPNGEEFRRLKDGHPAELHTLVMNAHGEMMPDDWRYEAIEDILDAIAVAEDPNELHGEIDSLVDVYNADLLRWVSSHLERAGYVDEAVEELGYPGCLFKALQYGQHQEYSEIHSLVLRELEKIAEEREEEDTEDEE